MVQPKMHSAACSGVTLRAGLPITATSSPSYSKRGPESFGLTMFAPLGISALLAR